MTDAEKHACKALKISTNTSVMVDESEDNGTHELLQAINRNKKRRTEGNDCGYINVDFILGSTAEIERIWSIAKYLLSDNRKKIEPEVFEALLFLKANHAYWDINNIQTAMLRDIQEGEE